METRPEDLGGDDSPEHSRSSTPYLMTKFIVTTLKLGVGNPNRDAVTCLLHTPVDIPARGRAQVVGVATEGANPGLQTNPLLDAIESILEAAVAVGIWGKVPEMTATIQVGVACSGEGCRTTGGGAGVVALETGRVLNVLESGLELACADESERTVKGRWGRRGVRSGIGRMGYGARDSSGEGWGHARWGTGDVDERGEGVWRLWRGGHHRGDGAGLRRQ